MPFARSLMVLLRSLLVEREPLYAQAGAIGSFAPSVFELDSGELRWFSDDAVGAALDDFRALYDSSASPK